MAYNENHATRCYDGQTLKERHPDLSEAFPKVRTPRLRERFCLCSFAPNAAP